MRISEKVLGIVVLIFIIGGMSMSSLMGQIEEDSLIDTTNVRISTSELEEESAETNSSNFENKDSENYEEIDTNEEVLYTESCSQRYVEVEEVIEEEHDSSEEVVELDNELEMKKNDSAEIQEEVPVPSKKEVVDKEVEELLEENIKVEEPTNYIYNDGVYVAKGRGYKSYIEVAVEMSKDLIKDVKILSHNESWGYYEEAVEVIPQAILESQNVEIDMVSGATYTSRGIIEATKEALELAKKVD